MFIPEVSSVWRVAISLVVTAIAVAIALYPRKKTLLKAQRQVREQCPAGGSHRLCLAQDHLGRGQIAYRSRCSKCNQDVGFGFDQIG